MNEIISVEKKKEFNKVMGTLKKALKKKGMPSMIALVASIVMLFVMAYLIITTISTGAQAVKESYEDAYSNQKAAAYQEKYVSYRESVEEKYHVSNSVSIYVEGLSEEKKLEVLKVQDVEFVLVDEKENEQNIEAWLEVPGEATFVVDLKGADFVIDNERKYVLVRIPEPELTNIKIDYVNVKKLLFKNDIFNESNSIGEKIAKEMLEEAEIMIEKEFLSNQSFYSSARKAAKNTIEMLIRQLNPNVENLTVDVEFIE